MPLSFSELKMGSLITIDNQPFQIIWQNFQRTAQRKPVMQTKMRNLVTGKVIEYSFKFGERIEEANVSRKNAQFLYFDGDSAHFMDNETYESFAMQKTILGDTVKFLKEGLDCNVVLFENKPIRVDLPLKVDYLVTETPPNVKGDTATGGTKPATLETGAVVQVPLFIKEGEKIKVNTESGDYVERSSS